MKNSVMMMAVLCGTVGCADMPVATFDDHLASAPVQLHEEPDDPVSNLESPDPESHVHEHGHEHPALPNLPAVEVEARRAQCDGRWAVARGGAVESVPYDRATRCTSGAQSGAVKLGRYVQEHFPGVLNESLGRAQVQIFNCRTVRGSNNYSIHAEGRAIDFMVPLKNGQADNERVDELANWLVANSARIGIQSVIWDRTYWRAATAPEGRCYGGTHPHHDHIHVELNWEAAREETPFFEDLMDEGHGRPNVSPPAVSDDGKWLGEPCARDTECASVNGEPGQCHRDPSPSGPPVGFCTIACAGYCPDRAGSNVTFCVEADGVGGDGGLCLARAGARNRDCTAWRGFDAFIMQRHVGRSNARASESSVCVPARGPFDWEAQPESDSLDESSDPDGNNGVCEDATLPLTTNRAGCSGVPEETWRCGCERRFETTVSQVCRGGVWINYQLEPADCAACSGRYSRACD